MTIEEAFRAICDNPEDDDLRLQFADLEDSADPRRAEFIRASLAGAHRRRHDVFTGERIEWLTDNHLERWAGPLVRFLPLTRHAGRLAGPSGLEFDRGFPSKIDIHPHVFLEYADLLFRLAPLRHVRFREVYDEDRLAQNQPFPLEQILAMPQLARLDSFGFRLLGDRWEDVMPKDTGRQLAACPHLTRCLWLDFGQRGGYVRCEELVESEQIRKMICLEHYPVQLIGEQTTDDIDVEHGPHRIRTFLEEGKELERRYGYIPWLHPSHNKGAWYLDVAWDVAQGNRPKYPPGTPPDPAWYEFPIEELPR